MLLFCLLLTINLLCIGINCLARCLAIREGLVAGGKVGGGVGGGVPITQI